MASVPTRSSKTCCCIRAKVPATTGPRPSMRSWTRVSISPIMARAEKPQFNVTLQRDFDEMAGTIEVFPQEITRVFLNLISNGFYAVTKRKAENGNSGFEPLLSATTRNLGNTVEIRIRDNGTGIPAEVKEKMFNPFFTTKPAGEGTGLGLSMSHDIIVKQHGGTIDVETEPGHFTEFTIVLPRTSNLQDKKRGET